jgi:hypothetical protein
MQGGEDETTKKVEALRNESSTGDGEIGQTVASMSDDVRLVTTLGKLSTLVKQSPEIWNKIWQRKGKEGELRTRIYVNLAYDKMSQRAGKITPMELNQLFAQHDQTYGTKLAYYKNGEVNGLAPLGCTTSCRRHFSTSVNYRIMEWMR